MADDKKKSKIDLKARLGKSSMSGPSGAGVPVPLPVPGAAPGTTPIPDGGGDAGAAPAAAPQRSPSVRPPVGIAPPPGLSPGIPVPPFAQQKREAPPPKPTAVQQTIKVEESEVIHQERKKAGRKIALYGALAALLGIGIGYTVGGAKANSDTGSKAVKTAGDLGKDVKEANEKLSELNTKLEQAAEGLFKTKAYPEQAAKDIASLVIPFDAETLGAKLGSVAMPTKFVRSLVIYTAKIKDVSDTKNKLGNALGNVKIKEAIEKYWKEEKEPVFNYSVIFFQDGQKGIQAQLVQNKDTFAVGKDWPANYAIFTLQRTPQGMKQQEKKATRLPKDASPLVASDPVAIPVEPSTVAAFSTEKSLNEIYAQLLDLKKVIEGNKEDPQDTGGLLKEGETLADDLRKAGLAR